MKAEERYWAKVDRRGSDECWEWTAFRNPCGYGMFRSDHEQLAHRFGYWLATGERPGDLCVCHRCDNPPCQNPHHFFLGTVAENHEDKIRKGRQARSTGRSGEANAAARMSAEQVGEIRERYLAGETQAALGDAFGVSTGHVGRLVRGDRWPGPVVRVDGLARRATGIRHGQARLTEAEVRAIRVRYAAGGVTQKRLADDYGVRAATVWAIVHGKARLKG